MVAHCPRCGYHFHRAPGQWLGSWFLNVCLAQMVAAIFLIIAVIATWPEPLSPWAVGVGVLATLTWAFAFFPLSRTIWVAIDLAMKPLSFGDGVAPGFELQGEIEAFHAEKAQPGVDPNLPEQTDEQARDHRAPSRRGPEASA